MDEPRRNGLDGLPDPGSMEDQLRATPWFANVQVSRVDPTGVAAPEHEDVESWDEVPSPEDPRVESLAFELQAVYDAWVEGDPGASGSFRSAHDLVLSLTLDPALAGEDAWNPRAQACWDAAFVSGLVAAAADRAPAQGPWLSLLVDLWGWYQRGRWPCAFADAEGMSRRLMVL